MKNFYNSQNIKYYDQLYKKGQNHEFPNLDLVRIFHSHIRNNKGKLLDFGAGSGENSKFISSKKGFQVYACESSKYACKLIKQKDKKIIVNYINDFSKLAYKNNFFDNIICLSVLSLMGSKKKIQDLINEFIRILKPGGFLLLDINSKLGNIAKDNKIKTYVVSGKNNFLKLIARKDLRVIFDGEVKKKYHNIYDNEYLALLYKNETR